MKKFVLAFCMALAVQAAAFSQAGVVTAPILEGIMQATHIDQLLNYAAMIQQAIEQAQALYNQAQTLYREEQRALQNLRGITEVRSYDDFMSWYNRQLYLERQAENRFRSMSLKVGGSDISFEQMYQDPSSLSAAAKKEYVDYWTRDLTDAERRRVWTQQLGMSPANYQYMQKWKMREEVLFHEITANPELVNEDNMKAFEANQALKEKYKNDAAAPDEERIGEKEILGDILSVMMDSNEAIRKQWYDISKKNAADAEAARAASVKIDEGSRFSEKSKTDNWVAIPLGN